MNRISLVCPHCIFFWTLFFHGIAMADGLKEDSLSKQLSQSYFPEKPFTISSDIPHLGFTPPPVQIPLLNPKRIYKNGYELTFTDTFEMDARVISLRRYWGDEKADIAPIDLAVAWGRLANEEMLNKIYFRQNNRFLYWRVDEFPVSRNELMQSTSNLHIIPANAEIEQQVKLLKKGEHVTLKGYLVNAKNGNNDEWLTSRSRDDDGDGACEIFFVEEVKLTTS